MDASGAISVDAGVSANIMNHGMTMRKTKRWLKKIERFSERNSTNIRRNAADFLHFRINNIKFCKEAG